MAGRGERGAPEDWEDLIPDFLNANEGTERGRELHELAITELGLGGAITLDADGNIIGGNKTAEIAAAHGFRLRVVDVAPDEAIAIRRADLHLHDDDDPRGRDLATALNRVAQVNLAWADTMLQVAEKKQGARARETFWFENERQGLTTAEAKREAQEADTAEGEQTPLTPPKTRQVSRSRQVYVVTCRDEDEAAELTEWLESKGIAWKEA